MGPVIIGTIRTFVPTVVGIALTFLFDKWGLDLAQYSDQITLLVTGFVVSAYYILATTLERKVNPFFGWLLGIPRPPEYTGPEPGEG